jgi:hypothetical protein
MPGPGDHDPGQRGADLPGQEALGRRKRAGGRLDVDVVEDDRGRLAAELEGAAGDPLAADRGDPAPGGGGPGEGDLVDPTDGLAGSSNGNVLARSANPLKVRSAPMPPPRATAASTPDSRGQIWPTSSERFLSSAPIARRYSARCACVSHGHGPLSNASRAAPTAREMGDDGYVAAVTPAETVVVGRPLLISLTEDGTALAEPCLVTDGDVKGGRYVSGVYDLVVGAGAPAS